MVACTACGKVPVLATFGSEQQGADRALSLLQNVHASLMNILHG